MHLRTVEIRNFRALEKIDVEFSDGANIIVGPNAIGKTTVLEAIRLAKALLANRAASESTQALLGLGAITQHNQQQLIPEAIARDRSKPVEIRCGYALAPDEVQLLTNAAPRIVTNLVQSRLGGNSNAANLAAFFSSSQGQAALRQTESDVRARLTRLHDEKSVTALNLLIDFVGGRIQSDDPVSAAFLSYLDQALPPNLTKFSYFTADRALPRGEQPVQLGQQDAIQQIEAHNSQPQLKYQRLKNTIFSAIVIDAGAREALATEFNTIFNGVLKGKQFVGPSVNQ